MEWRGLRRAIWSGCSVEYEIARAGGGLATVVLGMGTSGKNFCNKAQNWFKMNAYMSLSG